MKAAANHGGWPLDVFDRNFQGADLENETPAVLVASGAFSPVHKGHLEMLSLARERLERAGHCVLAAFLSPKGDAAAATKAEQLGQTHLRAPLRLRLCQLAVQEDNFISVASWEASQPEGSKPTHEQVARELREAIMHKYAADIPRNTPLRVFMVTGVDGTRYYKGLRSQDNQGLMVVPRSYDDMFLEKPCELRFSSDPPESEQVAAFSSTQVRLAVQGGDHIYVRRAVPQAAAELLLGVVKEQDSPPEVVEDLKLLGEAAERSEGSWPMKKVAKWLEQAEDDDRPVALMVSSGTFSPVHKGHLTMMRQAKARLEDAGYDVVGGWLSPVNDKQAAQEAARTGQQLPSAAFRLRAAQLAMVGDDLLSVGSWQVDATERTPGPAEVMESLRCAVEECYHGALEFREVRIFYVAGPDVIGKASSYQGIISKPNMGVVVVPRDSDDMFLEQTCQLVFAAEPAEDEALMTMNSTKVRASIRSRDVPTASKALPPAAARFVLSPTPGERKEFEADFNLLGVVALTTSELQQAKERLKGRLRSWIGPAGTIGVDELGKLLQFLDPSWNGEELDVLTGSVKKGENGGVLSDDFVDYIFNNYAK